MDVLSHNSKAWDAEAARGNRWTVPASPEEIARARAGRPTIVLTPRKSVPDAWLGQIAGRRILCLASGGGQQAPVLAAAGGVVTILDASPRQLQSDRAVAEREGLSLEAVQGDMADLSAFPDGCFDLIVHPISNSFVPEIRPVWREAYRVLEPGGTLLAGFMNPIVYAFDEVLYDQGVLEIRYKLPYSDLEIRTEGEVAAFADAGRPLEFSHSLEDQIGGQTDAGFSIIGFYEDVLEGPCEAFFPVCIATRAVKPGQGAIPATGSP